MKKYENKRVLVFSCIHAPYNHPDLLQFLEAIKKKYNPDRVVNLGDEWDNHSISFHQSDPDLFAATDEMVRARKVTHAIEKLFPEMVVIKSNHGSLVHRKVVATGLPRGIIKSYNEIYKVGDGWKWYFDYTLTLSNKSKCYFVHNRSADVLRLSKSMGMNCVQGHFHSKSSISYWANPNDMYWGMQVGCLFDPTSRAFAYNKLDLDRPLLTAGIIIDGYPKILPMVLGKNGRWIRRLV